MNSSNLIPVLAIAGAGSVLVIFWGAGIFGGSSTEVESVAVSVAEDAEPETPSTTDNSDTDYDFSWDDEAETSSTPTSAEAVPTEAVPAEVAPTEVAPENNATVEEASDEVANASDAETTFEMTEPTPVDSEDAGEKSNVEEFASEPFDEPWSSEEGGTEIAENSSETSERNNGWNEPTPVTPTELEEAPNESDWTRIDSEDPSADSDLVEPQPVEPVDVEKVDNIATTEEGSLESTTGTEDKVLEAMPEIVPVFTLAITNLSNDTANFCVDGEAVTLAPGKSFVAEKSGNEMFQYREHCEQVSSVPMKAGRYNVKAFPKSAKPSQAYRANTVK